MKKKNIDLTREKQRQIVEGACRLFFKKGFHQTTTRQIAEACNMSKGQLYHYISSKSDILTLIRKHVQELWLSRFVESDIISIESPFQKILSALRMTMDFNMDNRKLVLFLYTRGFYDDENQHDKIVQPLYKVSVKFWEDLLKEYCRKRPLDNDISMSARFIVHNMLYFVLNEVEDSREGRESHIISLVEFILKGLGLLKKTKEIVELKSRN